MKNLELNDIISRHGIDKPHNCIFASVSLSLYKSVAWASHWWADSDIPPASVEGALPAWTFVYRRPTHRYHRISATRNGKMSNPLIIHEHLLISCLGSHLIRGRNSKFILKCHGFRHGEVVFTVTKLHCVQYKTNCGIPRCNWDIIIKKDPYLLLYARYHHELNYKGW